MPDEPPPLLPQNGAHITIDLSPDEADAVASALRYKAEALQRLKPNVKPEGHEALDMASAELYRLAERFKRH